MGSPVPSTQSVADYPSPTYTTVHLHRVFFSVEMALVVVGCASHKPNIPALAESNPQIGEWGGALLCVRL
jgi:hypothetical protein